MTKNRCTSLLLILTAAAIGACGGGSAPDSTATSPGSSSSSSSSSSSTSSSSSGGGAGATALNVRVQGLALGKQLTLAHANATLTAQQNAPYSFAPQVAAGAPLSLLVTAQPVGQICAVSDAAPASVPADGSPVFVRCVSQPVARLILPDTLPNAALNVRFGLRDKAYPGIAYESRPGVVGGIFPYEYRIKSFSLNGTPASTAGVSLDFRRGTLRFTPPGEGTYAISIEIKDSGATQKTLDHSFTIQSATASFIFVATDGIDSAGRGTRAQPLRTLAYALANSNSSQLIVLRKGSYLTGGFQINDSRAKQLLAYPDEVVSLNLNRTGSIGVNSDNPPASRIEGFDITGVRQWGIVSDPSKAGLVIRNVRFLDGLEGPNVSENPAFIHGWGDSGAAWRHKFLIQENDFGTYVGAAYATTLFDAGESLIENNQLNLGRVNGGFHDKDNSQHNTYRENYIAFSDANRTGMGIQISAQGNSANVHIHHNLLINAGIHLGVQCFEPDCYMRNHDVHHNTIVKQHIGMNWGPFNSTSFGTRISHNIISNGSQSPYRGLSCQSRPSGLASRLGIGANLIESSHALAFKDSECTGNDLSWAVWQGTYGFDTAASGSTVSTTSALVGAGPATGLPTADARILQRGHQY